MPPWYVASVPERERKGPGGLGASSAGAVVLNKGGNARCPCLDTRETFMPIWPEDVPEAPPGWNHSEYGIGCAYHDLEEEECRGSSRAPWCDSAWCYVSPLKCTLPSEARLVSNSLAIWLSYPTCGYLDVYTPYQLESRLRNRTIITVIMTNSGGWKGSYCHVGSGCTGPMYQFLSKLFLSVGVKKDVQAKLYSAQLMNGTFPSPVLHQVFLDDSDEDSAFQACVYSTGMGYTDVCIGGFTVSAQRRVISQMITVDFEPIYLVSVRSPYAGSFFQSLANTLIPFTPALWVTILCITLGISLLMVWHERVMGGCLGSYSWLDAARRSVYNSFISLCSEAPRFNPITPGGQCTTIALGVLVFTGFACYTANLASLLLTEVSDTAPGTEISRIVSAGQHICVPQGLVSSVQLALSIPTATLVATPGRNSALDAIGTECVAATMRQEDLDKFHSKGQYCHLARVGQPLLYTEVGVPVSGRVARSMHYLVTANVMNGNWTKSKKMFKDEPICTDWRATHTLTVADLSGAICLSLGFALIGCCVSCCRRLIVSHFDVSVAAGLDRQGLNPRRDDILTEDIDREVALNKLLKRAYDEQHGLVERLATQRRPDVLPQRPSRLESEYESQQPLVGSSSSIGVQRPVSTHPHILETALQDRTLVPEEL